MKVILLAMLVPVSALVGGHADAQTPPGTMDAHWDEGAADCTRSPQPPLQTHRYDARTFILRENPCATREAPFMYLLVGARKALLIDTGDVADGEAMPLAATVMDLLPDAGTSKLPLLVAHTHGHLDHRAGDGQFRHLPGVTVVADDVDSVRKFFDFPDWPNGVAQMDLGGRIVDVIPTPGHHPSHVTYYDRQTALLFTGDFFLPGRLIIADKAENLASARRMADFVRGRPVSHVLGGHVELAADGEALPISGTHRPNQHPLQLTKQDLTGLPAMVASFNGFYGRQGRFVMYSQERMLMAFAAAALAILIGLIIVLAWFLRRRRRAKATG